MRLDKVDATPNRQLKDGVKEEWNSAVAACYEPDLSHTGIWYSFG